MKVKSLFLAVSAVALLTGASMAQEYNPVANPKAVVVRGDVRFTVLTPRVIRMEWSRDGTFEDHATLVFVNRRVPVPPYTVSEKDGWLRIETSNLH
ncbi:MAG: glycosyl hydrolase family 31, partial [Calditrichaeota bacterium]|nr:glycosyl hydrolase family 31 [Calditrichota bacterium]